MLNKNDEMTIRRISKETVVEAITEVMVPVLDKIMKTQDEHSERLNDIDNTVNRIETLQRSELGRVDDHELRIGKLEKKIA